MRHRLLTGMLLVLCAEPARAAPAIVPLDGVAGSAGVSARAMAADGTVVGGNALGGDATAWLAGPGGYTPQLLPRTPGLDDAFANAVNASGRIAGYQVDVDGVPTATVWDRTGGPYSASLLPTPVGAIGASAFAINTAGQVAGFCVTADGRTFGVVWEPELGGGYVAGLLPAPAGGAPYTVATAINDTGLIAGYGAVGGNSVPVVWDAGGGHAVFVVKSAVASAINNNGIGAGVDVSSSNSSPLVIAPFEGDYYGGALPDSGLGGNGASNWVNDQDVLVGYAVDLATRDVSGKEAALWAPTDVYWDYLNLDAWFRQQDPDAGARWTLRDANFITDAGLIVGDGTYDPDGAGPLPAYERSFVFDASTAVPEPIALSWFVVAGALLVRRRRHDAWF